MAGRGAPSRWRRHTWVPAAFTRMDLWVMLLGLIVVAGIRGYDYSTGSDSAGGLSVVEDAFPLWLWGVFILAGTVAVGWGLLADAHMPIWVGHLWLASIYLALALGIFFGLDGPWLNGVRSGADLLVFSVLHGFIALRMGPRPLQEDER